MRKALEINFSLWGMIACIILKLCSPADAQQPQPSTTTQVVSPNKVTPTDCSGTITTGGTSQYLIPTVNPTNNPITNIRGFMIMNVDTAAEGLCINFNPSGVGAATCSTTGYYYLQAATATASGGSYSSQIGFGTNKNPTIVAATTGHKFTCTFW